MGWGLSSKQQAGVAYIDDSSKKPRQQGSGALTQPATLHRAPQWREYLGVCPWHLWKFASYAFPLPHYLYLVIIFNKTMIIINFTVHLKSHCLEWCYRDFQIHILFFFTLLVESFSLIRIMSIMSQYFGH